MSFKIFFPLFLAFVMCGCGVKSPPLPPAGTSIPSYEETFYVDQTKSADEKKEKDKKGKK